MLNKDTANTILVYIEIVEELANFNAVLKELEERGYSQEEMDAALNELGSIAGRDAGIL